MEQSKVITYILIFLLGFIISKIIPDLCDKLYENSIIERFIIGGQEEATYDQEIECILGINEGNCGACFIINADGSYTPDTANLIEANCTSSGTIERNWMRLDTDDTGTTYSHGLTCNPDTYQCDEPCLR